MVIAESAFVAADSLLHYRDAEYFAAALRHGHEPVLSPQAWDELPNRSPEWLRYYRVFKVESWERQVNVAAYLRVGCEQRTLYLEWNGFVLPPIAAGYRNVDTPPSWLPVRIAWRTLSDLALLPVTLLSRVGGFVRWVRDTYGLGRGRTDSAGRAAHAFGAHATIRELGAGTRFPNFFHTTDSDQYLKILERRTLAAVQRFLTERGISTEALRTMVTHIDNSTVLDGCTVVAGNVGGSGNRGTLDSTSIRISGESTGRSSTSSNHTPD